MISAQGNGGPYPPLVSLADRNRLIVVLSIWVPMFILRRRKLPLLNLHGFLHPRVLSSGADAADEVAFGHPMPMYPESKCDKGGGDGEFWKER